MFFFKKNENTLQTSSKLTTGNLGEELAVNFLQRQKCTIQQRNYRKRTGEVDIVVKDKDVLVFVEVKTRRTNRFGSGFAAVDFRKQQQICKAALAYLSEYNCTDVQVRFDVIAVALAGKSPQIEWLKNAFDYVH